MKDKLAAHWGKLLFLVSVAFAFVVFTQASALGKRVDTQKHNIDKAIAKVNVEEPIENKKLKLTINQEVRDDFEASRSGDYRIEVKPTANTENWNRKESPIKVLVKGEPTIFKRPSKTSKYLANLNSEDVEIIVKDGYADGKIIVEKIPGQGAQLRIIGEEPTLEEPIQVTVRNKRYGDFAKFFVTVEQQIKFYYQVPVSSIETEYNADVSLDVISLTWKKASVSHTDSKFLRIEDYRLLRKEYRNAAGPGSAKFKAIKVDVEGNKIPLFWETAKCPFAYTDLDIKPLHSYQYRVEVTVWHTSEPISPHTELTEFLGFPDGFKIDKWLIHKTKLVPYIPNKAIAIGKGKILMGFTRSKNNGENVPPDAELIIKKWDNGQWISGLILLNNTKKVVDYGKTSKMFPIKGKKKTIENQIKDGDLLPIKGHAVRMMVGAKNFKNVPFDIDDYLLFRMKQHEPGDRLNPILFKKKYLDTRSLKEVYNAGKKIFEKKCSSFWLVNKNDPYFAGKIGAAFPQDMIVYFGSIQINSKMRKAMKKLNEEADAMKMAEALQIKMDPKKAAAAAKRRERRRIAREKAEAKKKKAAEEKAARKKEEEDAKGKGGPDGGKGRPPAGGKSPGGGGGKG